MKSQDHSHHNQHEHHPPEHEQEPIGPSNAERAEAAAHTPPAGHHGHGHEPEQPGQTHHGVGEPTYAGQEVAAHGSPHTARAVHGAHGTHAAHMAATPGGHDKHAGHTEEMFRRPFWITLILTIPVLIYAELLQELFGYTAPQFPGSQLINPVLGTVIYWYGGWVFLRGAYDELRHRAPGMMTLVALAISTAYFYSLAITLGLVEGMPFYWELATLVTIMLLGHWMEMRAVGSAQSALNELAKLLPDQAERLTPDGRSETVAVNDLRPGDRVLVRPGASLPADGTVEDGTSQVNEAMITGESTPVTKAPGDAVIAGSVNGSGSLRLRVTETGAQTALAGIMRLVAEAQTSRSRAQALADRAAFWLTLVAIGVALLTLFLWGLNRGLDNFVLERVVTVLVVACPHALGLAIPLVIAIVTSLGARNGILVRDRLALEQARQLTTVIFDKTGTLTRGQVGLVELAVADGLSETQALALTAAAERDSEHMLARALVEAAEERGLRLPATREFQGLPGRGVQAQVDGRLVQVGGPRLLEQAQLAPPPALAERASEWGTRGQTVVYLVTEGQVQAAFALADVIRPESRQAVAALQANGVKVAMLTGDSEAVARYVAQELGIDTYFAQVLPQHKAEQVKALQAQGERVAMVGDGVNDAPALAQADVGIAIGAGTDVARASAGIVLVRNDPRDVARIIALSRASYRKMLQNLGWAVGYNVLALPLAAGVLAGVGFVLPAWVGAVLMSLSTIIVALNAQTLRRLDLQRHGTEAAAG